MKAIDAMVVWTPNTSTNRLDPTRGNVAVVSIPEPAETANYLYSDGACVHGWKQTDDGGRMEWMQRTVSGMIHHDKIEEAAIIEAFKLVDEFNPYPFTNKPPSGNED
ncbi:MAG: hypothetical protein AAF724_03630 [Pseudomonadota bacterium]